MNTRNFLTTASALGLAATALALPHGAFAQDTAASNDIGNGEIVVTAQRRQERSVDVPITVATLSAETLTTANVRELADISKITPGLRFDNAGAFFQPTIRGIGTAVTTSGGGGNVGVYVDGFYSPNPLAINSQLLNVQSIQVLKGPQGTLFGRNTTGGAILIQSADPSTETSGQVKVSYGRYNEVRAQAYATYGLSENVAMDVEGFYGRGDGWQRDISNGGRRVGDYENWSVRLGLKADLGENVSVLLRYQHAESNDPRPLLAASYFNPNPQGLDTIVSGKPIFAGPGQFTYNPNEIASGTDPEFFRSHSDVIQGTIKADLGFANLTSYTQWRKETVDASQELDYSGADVFQLGLPNFNETFSQEFLLTSKAGPKLQWTAGLFYFQNRDTYETYVDNLPLFGFVNSHTRQGGSSSTPKSYAAFIDATYEISPQWFLTAGVRYAHDVVTDAYYNNNLFAGGNPVSKTFVPSISSDTFTPRAVIRFKPNDRSSIYASYTRGYKAAVIDVGGTCQNAVNLPSPSNPTGAGFVCNNVKPETIDAFEIGYKYSDRGLSLELSGFYYNYKNLQVSYFLSGQASIINAAKSRIYGIDGQIRYRFNDNFELSAGAAWTHARYVEFIGAPIYQPCATNPAKCGLLDSFFVDTSQTLTNSPMQRSPDFTGNIAARYKTDLGGGKLVLSGNLAYSSTVYAGPSGIQFPQAGYENLALRAEWTDASDRFTIGVFGDNVTNKRYRTQVQYANNGIGANWNKPTTYGIDLSAKF
ncbi:MAG: TonB-dependent receptor [Novosphingobium sp.]